MSEARSTQVRRDKTALKEEASVKNTKIDIHVMFFFWKMKMRKPVMSGNHGDNISCNYRNMMQTISVRSRERTTVEHNALTLR